MTAKDTEAMTLPMYDAEAIDLTALVAELSKDSNLPSSIHVRNLLLSGFAHQEVADVEEDYSRCSSNAEYFLSTLRAYQPAVQIGIIGSPPSRVLRNRAVKEGKDLPWAVTILKSSVFRTQGDLLSHIQRPDFSLWHSAEAKVASDESVDDESLNLFKHVIREWLPRAYERFQRQLFSRHGIAAESEEHSRLIEKLKSNQEVNVLAFAMEESFSDALLNWVKEGAEGVTVDWSATYATLQRYCANLSSSSESRCIDSQYEEGLLGEAQRWKLENLGSDSVQLVLSTNKLAFPQSHLLRKPFLTCLVRDQGDDSAASSNEAKVINNEYATTQSKGKAAGWVYTHEDLSLASLHVAPAYRRLTPKREGVPSVGRLLMEIMANRVARHQHRILRQAGVDADALSSKAWPVVADVEPDNEGSVAFYQRTGFVHVNRHTWLGLRVAVSKK
ncbi:unnamed protein product [Sympodiomycopsis kandeliae]